jgi:hypothetical protein
LSVYTTLYLSKASYLDTLSKKFWARRKPSLVAS